MRFFGFAFAANLVQLLVLAGATYAQVSDGRLPNKVTDGAPAWLKSEFVDQKFTFVRLRYDTPPRRWQTDFPDADLQLSSHLAELTSLKVARDTSVVFYPTDPRLFEYPFAYLSANGPWHLTDEEAESLRVFVEQKGLLMIDDSWGEDEWTNALVQIKKILPDRLMKEIPLEHEIFHCVYDFDEKPQVVSIHQFLRGEPWLHEEDQTVKYFGVEDDEGRLMVLVCHNNDLADGWERMGEDEAYTKKFSEQRALPMGVNIVYYALTKNRRPADE